jgi:hypothetical protein
MNNQNPDWQSDSMTGTGLDFPREREVSCRVISVILKYLESKAYQTDSLLKGLPYPRGYLQDPFNWVNHNVRETICQRAVELTQNVSIMYQVGLASPGLKAFGGLDNLVKLLANPQIAYNNVSKYAQYFDRIPQFDTTVIGEKKVIINMTFPQKYEVSKNSCYFAQGMLAGVPTLWGLPPAEVNEKYCMCDSSSPASSGENTNNGRTCSYEIIFQSQPPVGKRLLNNLLKKSPDASNAIKKLEENFRLLDRKNAELSSRNRQLAKVRELALVIDGIKTRDQVYRTVVELARSIPGVRFVIILKTDETGKYIRAPYFSRVRNNTLTSALKTIGFDLYEANCF